MKVTKKALKKDNYEIVNEFSGYDYYIAVDWSSNTMAIAKIAGGGENRVSVNEYESSVKQLQFFLKQLNGKTILVLEESSPAHWLYTNLHDFVTRIVICDPYKNRLLSDGPKTDAIDARKLCLLLYNGMIKEVYHGKEEEFEIRKYISAYADLVKRGVKLKNQRAGFLSQEGLSKKKRSLSKVELESTKFIVSQLEANIEVYEKQKKEYEDIFVKLCRKNKTLKNLITIPGIKHISAVKILGTIVDAKRFPSMGSYLAYCGLVSHIMESGGRIYGRRRGRYNHVLKEVYKTAAITALNSENEFKNTYDYYIKKGLSEHNARHALARYIARVSFGIIKSGKPYKTKNIEVGIG